MGIVINGNGIDMGNSPISNVSIDNQASVVDKAYVDDLKTIAIGEQLHSILQQIISI